MSDPCFWGLCRFTDGAARPGITEDVLLAIGNKSKVLNKSRKKRRAPDTLTDKATIGGWKATASHSPHLATAPGITCLDMHGQSSLVRRACCGVCVCG